MVHELDEIDRSILKLLQDDGRITISDIAMKLHVSRTAIRYRMHDMEKSGLIKGYTVLLNPMRLESSSIFVYILIQAKPSNISDSIHSLRGFKEVIDIEHLSGHFPLIITAFFRNPQHLSNFTLTKLEKLPIENYTLQPIIQMIQKGSISL